MSAKITLDQNKCIGCQACVQIDPKTFKTNPKNFKVDVINPHAINKNTKSAAQSCPIDAITINH